MKTSFVHTVKKPSFEQAKIVSINKLSGRVGISLRNGLQTSATYLYDIDDLRVGMNVLIGRVSDTYVIMNRVSNMPRTGVSYSIARPFVEPEPEVLSPGVYYSLNGIDWTQITNHNFYEGVSQEVTNYIGLYRASNTEDSPILDDYVYSVPEEMKIWDDDFTGSDGNPINSEKWAESYGSVVEIKNNTLSLKNMRASEYIISKGLSNTNIPMDVSVKTTIPNTGIHNKRISWAYQFPINDGILLTHTYQDVAIRYIYWLNYNSDPIGQGVIYLAMDDTEVWFRIITASP